MPVGLLVETSGVGPKTGHLLRILGVSFGIAVGVGTCIGGGILRTPGDVAAWLGTPQMVFAVWLLGGIYALLCSTSITELATMLPRAGGWYVYSQRAFGKRVGFVVGICDWTMQSVAAAFLAVAFGEFMGELLPGLSQHVTAVAVAGMLLLTLLNIIGLKSGSRTQTVTSLLKALALIILIVGCFTVSTSAQPVPAAAHSPAQHPGLFLGLLMALQAVLGTYDGWYAPIYFAEEDEDPGRNLPRSLIGTVLACVAIFLLANAAFFNALGMHGLQSSKVPAADASFAVFGGYARQVILVISLITVVSTINATLLTAPRVLYGMARDRLLPRTLTSINQGGTPAWALLLCALVSTALIFSGTLETLLAIDSVVFVAVYLSGFVALLVLRRREPHLSRPYRAWGYPWSTVCVLVASLAFLVGAVIGDLRHSLFTIVLVVLSYLASRVIVRTGADTPPSISPSVSIGSS
jgi:basic amino acid/polyamine antiporter, APA family